MMKKLLSICACGLGLLIAALMPTNLSAAPKEGEVDLTILKRIEELRPKLSIEEKAAIRRAERMIEDGTSDVRSGEHMADREPSALNPKEDTKAINARGVALMKSGNEKIQRGQREIAQVLQQAEKNLEAKRQAAIKKYDREIPRSTYSKAFETAVAAVLKACRDQSYNHILFDGIFISDDQSTRKAGLEIHNPAYDRVVAIDGTHFSVSLPINLELAPNPEDPDILLFRFANEPAFRGKQVALLVIEIIASSESHEALLAVRAVDLKSHRILTSELFEITDAAEALASEDIIKGGLAQSWIPRQLNLRDETMLLDRIAAAPKTYTFAVQTHRVSERPRALAAKVIVTDTIMENCDLEFVDSDFIHRAYANDPGRSNKYTGKANAVLRLTPSNDEPGSYMVTALNEDSEQSAQVGLLTLAYEDAEE